MPAPEHARNTMALASTAGSERVAVGSRSSLYPDLITRLDGLRRRWGRDAEASRLVHRRQLQPIPRNAGAEPAPVVALQPAGPELTTATLPAPADADGQHDLFPSLPRPASPPADQRGAM